MIPEIKIIRIPTRNRCGCPRPLIGAENVEMANFISKIKNRSCNKSDSLLLRERKNSRPIPNLLENKLLPPDHSPPVPFFQPA